MLSVSDSCQQLLGHEVPQEKKSETDGALQQLLEELNIPFDHNLLVKLDDREEQTSADIVQADSLEEDAQLDLDAIVDETFSSVDYRDEEEDKREQEDEKEDEREEEDNESLSRAQRWNLRKLSELERLKGAYSEMFMLGFEEVCSAKIDVLCHVFETLPHSFWFD